MSDDRAELEELRRLDELEARDLAAKRAARGGAFSLENFGRQGALAVRQGVEGLVGLGGIVTNPFQNLARSVSERVTGEPSSISTMSEKTSELFDRWGFPKEETGLEKVVGAVDRAVASGGGSIALARAAPAALPAVFNTFTKQPLIGRGEGAAAVPFKQVPPSEPLPTIPGYSRVPQVAPSNVMSAQPMVQAAQAGTGAAAAELTAMAGGSPWAQLLAGAVAPMGANAVTGVTKMAARGVNEARRPFTAAGANQIAADVVGSLASDKKTATQRIEDWLSMRQRNLAGVPGSQPTAGGVTGDYGLIQGEQLAARGPANPLFAERTAANNEARINDLARLNANKAQIARYETQREKVATPMREQAFAAATKPVDYDSVLQTLDRIAAGPAGGRVQSEKALEFINARVMKYLQEGRLHPEQAYGLYKDIGDMVKGKITDSSGAPMRLAAGLAIDVQKELGREIEKAAPGFQKYLNTYYRLSRPIDRLEAISERLGGADLTNVTNAMPQVGPGGANYTLSQDKVRRAVKDIENNLVPTAPTGLPVAPFQRDVMNRVLGDLDMQAVAARGGKPPGSDTYQNLATSNLLSGILSKELAKTGVGKAVVSPLNWAANKTGLEQRILDMINEAYLDPKKMAELLKIARTQRSFGLSDLATQTNRNIYGGLLGGAAGGSP